MNLPRRSRRPSGLIRQAASSWWTAGSLKNQARILATKVEHETMTDHIQDHREFS